MSMLLFSNAGATSNSNLNSRTGISASASASASSSSSLGSGSGSGLSFSAAAACLGSGLATNFGNSLLGSYPSLGSGGFRSNLSGYSAPMDRKRKSVDSGKDVSLKQSSTKICSPPGFDYKPVDTNLGTGIGVSPEINRDLGFGFEFGFGFGFGGRVGANAGQELSVGYSNSFKNNNNLFNESKDNINVSSADNGSSGDNTSCDDERIKERIELIMSGLDGQDTAMEGLSPSGTTNQWKQRNLFSGSSSTCHKLYNTSPPLFSAPVPFGQGFELGLGLGEAFPSNHAYQKNSNSKSKSKLKPSWPEACDYRFDLQQSLPLSKTSLLSKGHSPSLGGSYVLGNGNCTSVLGEVKAEVTGTRYSRSGMYNYISMEPRHIIDDTIDAIWSSRSITTEKRKGNRQPQTNTYEYYTLEPRESSNKYREIQGNLHFVGANTSTSTKSTNGTCTARVNSATKPKKEVNAVTATKARSASATKPRGLGSNSNSNSNSNSPKALLGRGDLKIPRVWAAIDEQSSRAIQRQLLVWKAENESLVSVETVREIVSNTVSMTKSEFGNFIIQRIIAIGDIKTLDMVVSKIATHVVDISNNEFGCRVIQRLLELEQQTADSELIQDSKCSHTKPRSGGPGATVESPITAPQLYAKIRKMVLAEIRPCLMDCVIDISGNHVIQKIVCTVDPAYLDFMFETATKHQLQISTSRFGCHVMQKLVENHASNTNFGPVLVSINEHIPALITDKFGNYVLQQICKHSTKARTNDASEIVSFATSNFVKCSKDKIASNVVELSLALLSKQNLAKITALVAVTEYNPEPQPLLIELIQDKYANYVIQKLLSTVERADFEILASIIKSHIPKLKSSTSNKPLVTKLQKLLA